ncbi:GntR family transcriptional regulator [[Enterobacter] lignolyticus]|uniref:Transcriptional regulator, GntR family n=2 Tax=[Enterobacter] lignolyticus TaxID=1334193 RepID=E3G5K8_ENTLS|nr:GntR family transcriptional regulator [[Enterobacter] lignolyticus]ADO50611.1 transcriptional regulator, GntR family [[Enterobacter] lignolyticus SCF1]ALR78809.1 GntR family transcriptional regulator [[Enterobacter] lignolyticus]
MDKNQSTVENAKEKLDRWLEEGITAAGGKLPSERELGELLGIKRMTLRQALLNLESESKIFRKDRKGWFVAQPRFNYSPELSASFQRAALEQGREPSWGFIEKSRVSQFPKAAEPLLDAAPSDALYRITGWGALEGHKVFYHETFINPCVAPGFIEQLENQSFSSVWENAYNKDVVIKKLAFKPVRMSGDISKFIGGSSGMPAILIEKHRADSHGNIVQIDIEYWRFEAVDLFINL